MLLMEWTDESEPDFFTMSGLTLADTIECVTQGLHFHSLVLDVYKK